MKPTTHHITSNVNLRAIINGLPVVNEIVCTYITDGHEQKLIVTAAEWNEPITKKEPSKFELGQSYTIELRTVSMPPLVLNYCGCRILEEDDHKLFIHTFKNTTEHENPVI